MFIQNLINYDLTGVKEIRCSEEFYAGLYPQVESSVIGHNLYFKSIPVIVDKSIRITRECNIVYISEKKSLANSLTNELNELIPKLEKARSSSDFSSYNTILKSYREIVYLMKDLGLKYIN